MAEAAAAAVAAQTGAGAGAGAAEAGAGINGESPEVESGPERSAVNERRMAEP